MIKPTPTARKKRTASADEPQQPNGGLPPIHKWGELRPSRPTATRDFWLRLKAGTFNSFTRKDDIAIVSPTSTVESGNAVLAWIKDIGALLCRVRIHEGGILKLFPDGIEQAAIPVRPGAIAWMLKVTAIHHALT